MAMANQDLGRPGRARWWGAGGGALLALLDTATLAWLGVTFDMNGRDVTLLVAAFFGSSFTLLGFLVGSVVDGRRRERRHAATIQAQTASIAAARARLAESEKLAALGQLAAAVAHEVRNPLAVIRSAAQGIAEAAEPGDLEAARACSFITAEVDRLGTVVDSLLAFARPLHPTPRPVVVRDLFDRALVLARDDLAAKQLRVRREDPADLPAARADPDLLCQVVLGLLANAAESAPPGGELTLEGHAADGTVELVVADSGPGVPPELRERIFEPFFTTRPRGTGLGLAVARQIVEAHGGRIAVSDRPAGGARFTVRLPAAA
jgi:two-component system sensor histidine kinase HydH